MSSHQSVRWLITIQLIAMGALEMSTPFWPLQLRKLGMVSTESLAWSSGLIYAGPLLMAILLTPLWGWLADRTGHKPMLLRALLALALTQLWIAQCSSVTMLIAARLVQGALAGFIAAAQAYGTTLVAHNRRGDLMTRLQMATATGSLIGPLLGGLLFDTVGFHAINLIAALLCGLCVVVCWSRLPALENIPALQTASPVPVLPGHTLVGMLVGITLVQSAKMAPHVFFAVYAEQVLHANGWQIGLCYGATAIGIVLCAPWWSQFFKRLPVPQALHRIELICWTCAALIAAQTFVHSTLLFLLLRLLWGVCLGALLPVFYTMLSLHTALHRQGHVLGLGNSAAKAGALLGLGIGSVALALLPPQHLFWPVALTYLIAACGIRRLRHQADGWQHTTSSFPG